MLWLTGAGARRVPALANKSGEANAAVGVRVEPPVMYTQLQPV